MSRAPFGASAQMVPAAGRTSSPPARRTPAPSVIRPTASSSRPKCARKRPARCPNARCSTATSSSKSSPPSSAQACGSSPVRSATRRAASCTGTSSTTAPAPEAAHSRARSVERPSETSIIARTCREAPSQRPSRRRGCGVRNAASASASAGSPASVRVAARDAQPGAARAERSGDRDHVARACAGARLRFDARTSPTTVIASTIAGARVRSPPAIAHRARFASAAIPS